MATGSVATARACAGFFIFAERCTCNVGGQAGLLLARWERVPALGPLVTAVLSIVRQGLFDGFH